MNLRYFIKRITYFTFLVYHLENDSNKRNIQYVEKLFATEPERCSQIHCSIKTTT